MELARDTSSCYETALQSNNGTDVSRRRRNRTVFTPESTSLMESHFDENRYPDIHQRETLASVIGVSEARVQVWYQNRRARSNKRKHVVETSEPTSDTPNELADKKHKASDKSSGRNVRKFQETPNEETMQCEAQKLTPPDRTGSQASVPQTNFGNQLPAYFNNPYLMYPFFNPPFRYPDFTGSQSSTFIHNPASLVGHWSQFPSPAFSLPQCEKYLSRSSYCQADKDDQLMSPTSNSADDNLVDRLFRFSSSGFNKRSMNKDRPAHMIFPNRRNSGCSMSEFVVSEKRSVCGSSVGCDTSATCSDSEGQTTSGGNDSGYLNDSGDTC